MNDPSVSIVTVVYAAELPLLRLQARSLSMYFQDINLENLIVCVNDRNEEKTMEMVEAIRHEYGDNSARLTVLGGDNVFSHPSLHRGFLHNSRKTFARNFREKLWPQGGWRGNNGWNMQQAFKLAAARHCDSEYIILLDAKNIFIRAVSSRDFFDDAGRPRSSFHKKNKFNSRWYLSSARTIGQKKANPESEYISFVTPFCLKRQWLCEILGILDSRNLPVEFIFSRLRNRTTEFMLVNAWINLQGKSVRDFFAEHRLRSYTVFQGMNDDLAAQILTEAFHESAKCIGIHSRVLGKLSDRTFRLVCQHLVNGQIANSFEDAYDLLSDALSVRGAPPGGRRRLG